jgi:uncharacterized protein (TIGR00251 family)
MCIGIPNYFALSALRRTRRKLFPLGSCPRLLHRAPLALKTMIEYTERNGALVFAVVASPRASRTEIVGEHDGALRVRLKAAPVDGAANEELIRILAKTFGVARADIQIISGHASKRKLVSVTGLDAELVQGLKFMALEKS